MPPRSSSVALRSAEAGLGLLTFVAFLCLGDLPLVDLPQHALQLANWLRIDAGDPGVSALQLNFRTPYLLAYPLARLLAPLVSVLVALKLVFAASVVLQAFALRKLSEALGHDPWLGLLGFPLALGYSLCWGFVSFCAAIPLIYLAFALAAAHREAPRLLSGVTLAATLALLLVAHGVALAFSLVVLGPLLLLGGGKLWQRGLPLLAPVVLGLVWLVPGRTSARLGGDYWPFEPDRILELPGQLVGIGSADWTATVGGLALIGVVVWSLGARREAVLFMPLLVALLGYLFFPTMFRGAGPLGPRFSVYLVPGLLLAFSARAAEPARSQALRRGLLLLVAVFVPLLFCWRLPAFNRETAELHALISPLPAGLRLRPIVFERSSATFPGNPAHLHLPAYYSVSKGGDAGYSFAMYDISVVRLRPGAVVKMGGGAEWAPQSFRAETEAEDYDYFIVRSSTDLTSWLFPGPSPAATLDRRVGSWWGYRRNL